jgi:hypothetical protein
LPDDGFRDRCIFEVAHCQDRTNRIKCFHENTSFLASLWL